MRYFGDVQHTYSRPCSRGDKHLQPCHPTSHAFVDWVCLASTQPLTRPAVNILRACLIPHRVIKHCTVLSALLQRGVLP